MVIRVRVLQEVVSRETVAKEATVNAVPSCSMCGCPVLKGDGAPEESAAYRWAGPVHLTCALIAQMEFEQWLDRQKLEVSQ